MGTCILLLVRFYNIIVIYCLVMAPDGQTLYRVPMLNIVTHALGHPARGEDEGVVWVGIMMH